MLSAGLNRPPSPPSEIAMKNSNDPGPGSGLGSLLPTLSPDDAANLDGLIRNYVRRYLGLDPGDVFSELSSEILAEKVADLKKPNLSAEDFGRQFRKDVSGMRCFVNTVVS